ncbi:hypothetical protein [Pseudoxanthomonas sp. GM95]|uniref:hypothetical protein n=1 Tax=Pseudoxanthomonas sp. GM95 TaxID=1881043 RepID=UPI0011146BAA|nr:hypothetical protein [Pseudoxanthomonas sp. GM95]
MQSAPPMPDWLQLQDEADYWRAHLQALPCARQGDTLEDCWPLIECVYLLYVRHPRATLQEALHLYEAATKGLERGMDHEQMATLFARVWSRILKRAGGRALPDWLPGAGGDA